MVRTTVLIYGNNPQTLSYTHTSIWPLWKNWHYIRDSK